MKLAGLQLYKEPRGSWTGAIFRTSQCIPMDYEGLTPAECKIIDDWLADNAKPEASFDHATGLIEFDDDEDAAVLFKLTFG